MMVSFGGEILIILAVLFTVITQVTPDTCAQLAKSCSYKTTDILNITVDCSDTMAILHWTADDDLNSDFPFTLEYNCTNISSGELLPGYPMSIVYWGVIGSSKSGSHPVNDDPYIGSNGAYCTFGGCVVSSDCWYISKDTPICNPPVATIIVSSTKSLLPSLSVVPKQSVATAPLAFSTDTALSSSYSSSLYSSSSSSYSSSSYSTSVTPSTTSSTVSSSINAFPILISTILVVVFAAVFIVILTILILIICLAYRKLTKRHQDKLNDVHKDIHKPIREIILYKSELVVHAYSTI